MRCLSLASRRLVNENVIDITARRLVYAVYLNIFPTTTDSLLETLTTADHDVGTIGAAMQQAY